MDLNNNHGIHHRQLTAAVIFRNDDTQEAHVNNALPDVFRTGAAHHGLDTINVQFARKVSSDRVLQENPALQMQINALYEQAAVMVMTARLASRSMLVTT